MTPTIDAAAEERRAREVALARLVLDSLKTEPNEMERAVLGYMTEPLTSSEIAERIFDASGDVLFNVEAGREALRKEQGG